MTDPLSSKPMSLRLREIAVELSRIAGQPPPEANGPQLAVIASRLMDLSMHVELGERADSREGHPNTQRRACCDLSSPEEIFAARHYDK